MFGAWNNIAKSAEAVVSRWALKRVFKFVLKKKLGRFILGDIDLDQLDVQLAQGTIHLSDLAINVDYLNSKFGAAASVVIKEGSIGSLLVKMPWKGQGCQVEVDELELVFGKCSGNNFSASSESCSVSENGNQYMQTDSGKHRNDVVDNSGKPSSGDVHEGVKTIAKMVKWFLTSFHVKIRKLIVAFDPYIEKDEKKIGPNRTLVLRIAETECGASVSQGVDSTGASKSQSFLGISQLTNFVQFQGAILELLQMDNVDDQSPCTSGANFGDLFSGCSLSSATTPIMTGKGGGFSGSLKLSIPWKNGSLDIRKVDADISIDPVELRIQPSTIKWFLISWENYKNVDKSDNGHMHYRTMDSVYLTANSQFHSSTPASSAFPTDKMVQVHGGLSGDCSSLHGQESVAEALLPGAHLISDWVPFSVRKENEYSIGKEVDFGASVDQFFECFDGIRSSQSALGSSGMWNWTCSVFSAITAASSLASGSLHVPSEQQHVQTNLRANFAGFSILCSFHDEDQKHLYNLKGDKINAGSNVHYLGAECRDTFLVMQLCPQEMRFDGRLKHIEVADYLCRGNGMQDGCDHIGGQTLSIRNLQAEVQHTLPLFSRPEEDPLSDQLCDIITANFPFRNKGDIVKVMLFRTYGVTCCQFTVSSNSQDGSCAGPSSFSLKLPHLMCWLNFGLINMLFDLLKEVGNSVEPNNKNNKSPYDACNDKCESSHGYAKRVSGTCFTTLSSTETWRGDISISNARVIVCFPFENGKDDGAYASWDQFIALDITSSATSDGDTTQSSRSRLDGDLQKHFSPTVTLCLNVGNLDIYLITSSCKKDIGIDISAMQRHRFSAQNILSVSNSTGSVSVISMLWQEGCVTGPWIAERAKLLATPEETRSRGKFMGKGYEFATVTTVKDQEDENSQTRQEIILSSSFVIHVHLFPVAVNLGSSQYKALHCLLDQIITGFSSLSFDAIDNKEGHSMPQTSIFLECDSMEISIRPDAVDNLKGSMLSELPGSWNFLTLKVQRFNLLSVSNIGGIRASSFLWLAHSEGTLSGSVTGVQDHEFLLISCSNSAMKRGDGGGSNVLSSRPAGSDIVYLWEPESVNGFTSISVRCSTVVAVGGRLDWVEAISSFFSSPSQPSKTAVDDRLNEEGPSVPRGASFALSLVDVALSYEPHFNTACSVVCHSESGSSNIRKRMGESYVACLLAASSLTLSNRTLADSTKNEYKIRVQDLGLLLCAVSEHDKLEGNYSVDHLHDIGFVKVAREALVEVILKTNSKDGLLWELACSKSQIYVETCHDTTSGLIRLAAQLQQLFAPDMEESIGHLQTRWNHVQQAQQMNGFYEQRRMSNCDSVPSTSQQHTENGNIESKCGVGGLMDEISENAFNLDGSHSCQSESSESNFHVNLYENIAEEACSLSFDNAEIFSNIVNGIGSETNQTSFLQNGSFPELIESYCLSELLPLSELPAGRKSTQEILKSRSLHMEDGLEQGNSGWYDDALLKIVENHVSSEQASLKQFEGKFSCGDCSISDDFVKVIGRVLLKNINVRWRMYAGSDWQEFGKNGECNSKIRGRETSVCLELVLSGIEFLYDVFPAGGISVSKLALSIQDFHLYDRSTTAPWKLVLGYYNSKDHPRESSSKAFKLDLEAVRPDPLTPLEEYRLRIAFLPMLLHLHQCQLDFLISYFGEESSSIDQSSGCLQDPSLLARSDNLVGNTIADEALLPYFQKFDIWPILVRVDYSPHHVDLGALRGGKYVELINLIPWKGIELQLKHVHAVGVYGWGSVCETIIGEWLEDISQNQIRKVLRGIPTIRSLFAVGAGAAKLVALPIESYRKDQRVLKGMQRGTVAFLRSISLEAIGLGVHLAAGAHDILLQAEYMLTSIPPHVSWPSQDKTKTNVRYNQPKGAQQGIQQAYESISDGLEKSASALVRTPLKKYQRGASAGSALATAVRALPTAAIAPASACATAIHYALLGLRNSLDPERKKESMEKYLGPTEPQDQN